MHMGTFPIDQLAGLLNSLGERARSAPNPDLRAAVGLVSGWMSGGVAISGGEGDIRATQSAVGALMRRIGEGEQVGTHTFKNLQVRIVERIWPARCGHCRKYSTDGWN